MQISPVAVPGHISAYRRVVGISFWEGDMTSKTSMAWIWGGVSLSLENFGLMRGGVDPIQN